VEIILDVPFDITLEEVLKASQFRGKKPEIDKMINFLITKAYDFAKPKILFKEAYLNVIDEKTVEIERVIFQSRILKKNLENIGRVFPYIITAGRELEGITIPDKNIIMVFFLDTIKELILKKTAKYFESYLLSKYSPGTLAHMSPGSLEDWPVEQQKPLFSLFGDVEKLIGVRLTSSYLMDPIKSVSGIQFPTRFDFKSCMLCKRFKCPDRKVDYDPKMASRYNQ